MDIMVRKFLLLLPLLALTAQIGLAQDIRASKPVANAVRATANDTQDQRVYELRTYFASQGKLDDLHHRFKEHMLGLHEKYGISNLGYWVPTDNPKRMIVTLVSYPDMEARERSWARLSADREWINARRQSEANGRILDAVREEILTADQAADVMTFAAKADRSLEIRRFTAESGKAEEVKALVRDQLTGEVGSNTKAVIRFFSPTGEGNRTSTTLIAFVVRPKVDNERMEFVNTRGGVSTGGESGDFTGQRIPGEIVTTLKATEYSPSK